jgi:hypothetical protein
VAQRGVGPLLKVVVGDVGAAVCSAAAPRARKATQHLTVISSSCLPVRDENRAASDLDEVEASLESLGRTLDELVRLHVGRHAVVVRPLMDSPGDAGT